MIMLSMKHMTNNMPIVDLAANVPATAGFIDVCNFAGDHFDTDIRRHRKRHRRKRAITG